MTAPRPGLPALLALALALAATACGHRGPIGPPLPRLPQAPQALVWRQRGDRLEVVARYRPAVLAGGILEPPVHPALLWHAPRDPADLTGWETRARSREFARSAQAVPLPEMTLPSPVGGTVPEVQRIDGIVVATFGGREAVVVAVALADERRRSIPSDRVVFRPLAPPLAPPVAFEAKAEEAGIRLRWTAAADERIEELRIYRAVDGIEAPLTPWRIVREVSGELLDDAARYGQRVSYSLASGRGRDGVPVESETLTAPPVDYRDEFPPPPPSGIDGVPETGRIRIFWFPSGARDEAGFLVEREVDGREGFVDVGRVDVPESSYDDGDVRPGQRYRYRVRSIDGVGNRSELAGPTQWIEPRPPPAEQPAEGGS